MLDIKNIVVNIDGRNVVNGLNLSVGVGETHILMGKNGSGKTSLVGAILGSPKYKIVSGEVLFEGKNIMAMNPYEIARAGIFLSFQNPIAIKGLSFSTLLKYSVNSIRKARGEIPLNAPEFFKLCNECCEILEIDIGFLKRDVNVGFSGGEKKRMSMLEMMMVRPKLAILDEPDSGVDAGAVNIIFRAISKLAEGGTSFLIISHYPQMIGLLQKASVHLMESGKIIAEGDVDMGLKLLNSGFKEW